MKQLIIFLFAINSLLYSQWSEVKVYPHSGTMHKFYMTDSLNITAVFSNDSCYVIKSRDGGRNWVSKYSIPMRAILFASVIDENNIFVGSVGPVTLMKTSNGGATWTNLNLPSHYNLLNHIQFLDPNTGFVMGSYGQGQSRLLKTTDGGTSWIGLDSSISFISSFHFDNPQSGWFFGTKLYRTTNGGISFTEVQTPAGFSKASTVDIFNNNLIMIGGYRTLYLSTYEVYNFPQAITSTDGGLTWSYYNSPDFFVYGRPENLKILNENTAVCTLDGYSGIFYTTNRGQTWGPGGNSVKNFVCTDLKTFGNSVYLAGNGISFLASGTNLSGQWDLRTEQEFKNPLCASFFGEKIVIGAEGGKIYLSTDRGNTWTTKKMPFDVAREVLLVNDNIVYFGALNRIYRSTNFCESIEFLAEFGLPYIEDIKVLPNGDIWVCSGNNVHRSTDQGITWVSMLTQPNMQFFKELQIFNDGIGYATNGDLFKTTDYGNTWNKLAFSQLKISEIEFYDSKNGFVGRVEQGFYRTHDGGISFQYLNIPGMTYPFSIYCKDSLSFFVAANKLYSTYDGGWSWKPNEFPTISSAHKFRWMHMYDQLEGIGVNTFYGVWKTYNRGNTPVELSLFSALPFGNKVVLQWTTETETNNMGFEIERKYRNGEWKKIAFSKGSGTSTRKIFYGYDDYEPKAPAILYYRLKQIDYNGEFEYSNEVEVLLGELPENYSIQQNYPNPFNPSTKVTFSLPEENKVVIKVFNAMGEQVKEIDRGVLSHGYFEQDFEMSNESSGMYFCQVFCTNTISGRTKSLTVKMVLMK